MRPAGDVWVEKFNKTPGTHIDRLISAWGEPEKIGNNEYRWFKHREHQLGGYSEPDGYTTQRVYNARGRHVVSIDTPRERYVAPYTIEKWCEILVTTDKKGIITRAGVDGSGHSAFYRADIFPFPAE
jgi:hypothetical protein